MKPYNLLPGKTDMEGKYLPLWMHLEDTAYVMEYLCKHRLPGSVVSACGLEFAEFKKVAVLLAMLHDIGKCTPLFAARILPKSRLCRELIDGSRIDLPEIPDFLYQNKSPHAGAGEAILEDRGFSPTFCSIVGAHHGVPISESDYRINQIDTYGFNFYARQKELWTEMQNTLIENALEKADYGSKNEIPELTRCAQTLLCGLLIEADWIASNQYYFPLLDEVSEGVPPYPERAETALAKLALPDIWRACDKSRTVEELFTKRFGFSPNAVQKLAAESADSMPSSGLMIIEAQMGVGKTEAALAAAEIMSAKAGTGGIFFGLPTQATSNGIFKRIANWAEAVSKDGEHAIRLVHGMAELNEDYTSYFRGKSESDDEDNENNLIAHSWFSGKKQALLADFVVGTVDTALMSVLAQKHFMLRHTGLCGKTVIIDECHAYDAYMSSFLDLMLDWLGAYGVPVILLSATLPGERKRDMLRAYLGDKKLELPEDTGYPLITRTCDKKVYSGSVDMGVSSSVAINRIDEDELADNLAEAMKGGGCAGVIVNTVKRAQTVFENLKGTFPDKKVYLYHAQFITEDRIENENALTKMIGKDSKPEDRDNVIIVGTQVLEQSLDIDFDYLVTELCPMDLLLQRIGRLFRHRRKRPETLQKPVCSVICSEDTRKEGSYAIYGKWLLKRTLKFLPESVKLPYDIPKLVDRVYAVPDEQEQDADWEEFYNRTKIKEGRAETNLLQQPKRKPSRFPVTNSMIGMLGRDIESEKRAEASVRDGLPSLDVLVMKKLDDNKMGFLSKNSDAGIRTDLTPSAEEGKKIARQKLRLPFALCCGKRLDKIVGELESENKKYLPLWQESPWIKGELVLILDENNEKDLGSFHLKYEKETGLTYTMKE